ncbi:MAG: tetratricopeptide repeat protein [Candidatus Omnitrophica bacterium]|nr:tetratricopeptide repeat protein [Candidatus Omnitrophota bacterium]
MKCLAFALMVLIAAFNTSHAQESAREIFERAVEYHNQNSFDEAIAEFSKVIDVDPEYSEAYYNRGLVYAKKGDYEQAIIDFTSAIGIEFDYADAYVARGLMYFFQEDYDKSWADVHKAESFGKTVEPDFIEILKSASGREE